MASSFSFDVVSDFDRQELVNAVDQTVREVNTRYDLKDTKTEIILEEESIKINTASEFTFEAVKDILTSKVLRRGLSLKILDFDKIEEASGGRVRSEIKLKKGIAQELAKEISKTIRDNTKATAQIQGDSLRVTSKSKDDLQSAIALLKGKDYPVPLQFNNYRWNNIVIHCRGRGEVSKEVLQFRLTACLFLFSWIVHEERQAQISQDKPNVQHTVETKQVGNTFEAETLDQELPDPIFKEITWLEGAQVGLQAIQTEYQHSFRSDLVLKSLKPHKLKGTFFRFFRTFNSLEFKSENDKSDKERFNLTEIRARLVINAKIGATYENTLNIIVCSREPKKLLNYIR